MAISNVNRNMYTYFSFHTHYVLSGCITFLILCTRTSASGTAQRGLYGYAEIVCSSSLNGNQNTEKNNNGPIGGDLISTLRLNARLCADPKYNSEDIAQRFFDCYDEAPGKPQFLECQQKHFKGLLNTRQVIDSICTGPQENLALYLQCLAQEFQRAGVSFDDALTKVNICEGKVLGFGGN